VVQSHKHLSISLLPGTYGLGSSVYVDINYLFGQVEYDFSPRAILDIQGRDGLLQDIIIPSPKASRDEQCIHPVLPQGIPKEQDGSFEREEGPC
jgi:hypothetical protein